MNDPPSAGMRTRLSQASIDLMNEQGVLSAFTLREVADRAGVSPGNIYYRFGDRRGLLRHALAERAGSANEKWRASVSVIPFVARHLPWFEGRRTLLVDAQLSALLAIDGDDSADPMPFLEDSVSDLRQSVADGDIHPDYDLVAVQVMLLCLRRGYQIFRRPIARRTGVSMKELDSRVEVIAKSWLAALAHPPDADG